MQITPETEKTGSQWIGAIYNNLDPVARRLRENGQADQVSDFMFSAEFMAAVIAAEFVGGTISLGKLIDHTAKFIPPGSMRTADIAHLIFHRFRHQPS